MRKHRKNNITLIGMAGAGKSVFGKKLAKKLRYGFLDVDDVIRKQTGLDLQAIIDRFGEKRFLEIEEAIVADLGLIADHVISPGGSVVYSRRAMNFLKKISKVILLDASFASIERRISNTRQRGIIGLKGKSLKAIYEERNPLYKKYADLTVEVADDLDADDIVEKISSI